MFRVSGGRFVAKTGNNRKPVWMTEGACYYRSNTTREDDDRRASCFAGYLLNFMGRGTSLVTWFGWDFGGPAELLLDHTGIPNDRLNKGGKAVWQIYNWTVERGATMTQPCTGKGTAYSCTLTDAKGNPMLVLYDTSLDCTGTCVTGNSIVPPQYKKWTDLDGKTHTIVSNTVPVGHKQILLEAGSEPAREPTKKR